MYFYTMNIQGHQIGVFSPNRLFQVLLASLHQQFSDINAHVLVHWLCTLRHPDKTKIVLFSDYFLQPYLKPRNFSQRNNDCVFLFILDYKCTFKSTVNEKSILVWVFVHSPWPIWIHLIWCWSSCWVGIFCTIFPCKYID